MSKKKSPPKQQRSQQQTLKRLAKENRETISQVSMLEKRVTDVETRVDKLERENRNLKILRENDNGRPVAESANDHNLSRAQVYNIINKDKKVADQR